MSGSDAPAKADRPDTNTWFIEGVINGSRWSLSVDRLIHAERTEYQELVLFENHTFGRVLTLDGFVQTTSLDEATYHEGLVHTPLLAHPEPRRVLIVGGGDGGAAREALKHPSVESVMIVDIDEAVVRVSKQYLPEIHQGVFDNPKLEVRIEDGIALVKAWTGAPFDVIIVDSTDPEGPAEVLFSEEFYEGCRRALSDDGIIVTQAGLFFLMQEGAPRAQRLLKSVFGATEPFINTIPAYALGPMAFGFAWKGERPDRSEATYARRIEERGLTDLKWFTASRGASSFDLPPLVRGLLKLDD